MSAVAKRDPMQVTRPHASGLNGNPVACSAHTRSGEPCRMPAMANGKCRMHGGKSLSGVAAPAYKGAGRSRVVPARWSESYQGAIDDPDLLSLRHDIASVDSNIDDLLARLPDSEEEILAFSAFMNAFGAMIGHHQAANKATKKEDREKAERDFFTAFESACLYAAEVRGYKTQEMEIEARVSELRNQRRLLVQTETQRLTAAVQSMRVESVKAILWALLDILRREISDKKLLQRIQDRFRAEFQAQAGRKL